jgi:glycosyltransferase involved in cell wall biosynthesis
MIPLIYAWRALRAYFSIGSIEKTSDHKFVIFSAGDFVCDVLPAIMGKRNEPNTMWVANIYHVIQPPGKRKLSMITDTLSFFAQRISFWVIRRYADKVFVLNEVVKLQLTGLGFDDRRIYVVGAGIDVERLKNIAAGPEQYDACFLGRLHRSKGVTDLVDIWQHVSKATDASLAIVYTGSGALIEDLKDRIEKRKLNSRIHLMPLVGDNAISVVKSSKIFVFPSHEEGWGIAIFEAMYCGLPVIAYDLPHYRHLFTSGIIRVPEYDFARFSEAVITLLADQNRRSELSSAGKILSTKYTWDLVARRGMDIMIGETNTIPLDT